jgi:hypothetical protein
MIEFGGRLDNGFFSSIHFRDRVCHFQKKTKYRSDYRLFVSRRQLIN